MSDADNSQGRTRMVPYTSPTATQQAMEAMQLEISELCHQLRQLNQLLKKTDDGDNDNDDDEGGSKGRLTSFEKAVMKLSQVWLHDEHVSSTIRICSTTRYQ